MLRELVKSLAENKVMEGNLASVQYSPLPLEIFYFIYNIFKTVIGNDSNAQNESCIVN